LWWQHIVVVAAQCCGGSTVLWWQHIVVVAAQCCGGSTVNLLELESFQTRQSELRTQASRDVTLRAWLWSHVTKRRNASIFRVKQLKHNFFVYFSILKTKALPSFETAPTAQPPTQCHIPEDLKSWELQISHSALPLYTAELGGKPNWSDTIRQLNAKLQTDRH
jgi:hypothetical protein